MLKIDLKTLPKMTENCWLDSYRYSLGAIDYRLYNMDEEDDFGTFDFSSLKDLEEARESIERFLTDYDAALNEHFGNTIDFDRTFENEIKISPAIECSHVMEKKFLLTSHYMKCKKCGFEA